MTYIVYDFIMVMRGCNKCGEQPDEDGYASCDCHRPREYCDICNEYVIEDTLDEKIAFDFKTIVFCEDCEENFYEEQNMWWQQMSEDYHDLLYEIHQTIEMIQQRRVQ